MGRPPAVVIIARHGARLDAADKQWHLTSPTPYDPPLTYGGWTQCRALGARIAGLLQAREALFEEEAKEKHGHASEALVGNYSHHGSDPSRVDKTRRGRRKKHRIMIHSSPFQRCVQTSVAISAGISQYRGTNGLAPDREGLKGSLPLKAAQSMRSASGPPSTEHDNTPSLAAIADEESATCRAHRASKAQPPTQSRPRLRLDAFLGEWLSPDYYESITPPPGSVMMIAGAKADLLRRGEYVETSDDSHKTASIKGHFPGGWGSAISTSSAETKTTPDVDDMEGDLSKVSLKSSSRDRSSTQGSLGNNSARNSIEPPSPRDLISGAGYKPPIPRYAISPSEPIPTGYVQHARDACIEIDYQWDSMRAPQDWGDGGEYGEEWSSMHKRFRKGLQSMIMWYRLHHESSNQTGGHKRILHPRPDEEDDEDTDTVLILVTHGAGCNALIGALTNQPVLLDVSMASLTMAVRKDDQMSSSHNSTASSPVSPNFRYHDHPLSADYTVLLTASTEHLQSSSPSPLTASLLHSRSTFPMAPPSQQISQGPSPRVAARRSRFDDLHTSNSATRASISPFVLADPNARINIGTQRSSSAALAPRRNGGLWSKSESTPKVGLNGLRTWTVSNADARIPSPDETPEAYTAVASPTSLLEQTSRPEEGIRQSKGDTIQGAGSSDKVFDDSATPLGGLWEDSSAESANGEYRERERGFKRRWTVNERA